MSRPRSTSKSKPLFAAALILLAGRHGFASPCCGGSAAAPALISGDERAQLGLLLSRASVIGDAPAAGIPVFRSSSESEILQTLRIDSAFLLSDRWQAGAVASIGRREHSRGATSASAAGIGDLKVNLAFEALPEWTYSPWKPKGYVFAQLSLPTGRSVHESASAVDAFGAGTASVAAGALFIKRWRTIDAFVLSEVHQGIARSLASSDGTESEIVPGPGASLGWGAGWSSGPVRAGFRVQPAYSAPRRVISGGIESVSSRQLVWDTGLDLTYLGADSWSWSASYTDQTLFGPAVNATLSRIFALSLQRRWDR